VNRSYYRLTRVITPAASLDLVTLAQAKAMLGVAPEDTTQDAQIQQHISSCSLAINNFCDRIFVVQGYRDQVRNAYGSYGEAFVTRQYPIVIDGESGLPLVAVTENSVVLDPAFVEVQPDNGSIYRLDSTAIPSSWNTAWLVVDYTAGFDPIPADVRGACLEWVGVRYGGVGRDPAVRSETIPDLITQVYGSGSDTSSTTSMPVAVRDYLIPYKIWTV